jgi:hypothetical protein
VQGRYMLLGTQTNVLSVDWAQADLRWKEQLSFRAGKVKTPAGLLNESQDIDPAQLWIELPNSIYSIASRNSTLSHDGGVVYGTIPLGKARGKAVFHVYGGERGLLGSDGLFQPLRDKGITLPDGASGPMYGATLMWQTPLRGLTVGASEDSEHTSGQVQLGALNGTLQASHFYQPYLFGRYEGDKWMIAGEYTRQALLKTTIFAGGPTILVPKDQRSFYVMTSYRIARKLTGGMYYSSALDRKLPVSSGRYSKDWCLSLRYDVDSFLYLKAEQHFIDGTELGYSSANNTAGLKPNDRMTFLKLGVSF